MHLWHIYGPNATAIGVLITAILNVITLLVLIRTLVAVNAESKAATRQAQAAEQQVIAAKAASATSEAQRRATEESAAAEKEHSELIRQQLLASMRPVVIVIRDSIPGIIGQHYFVQNHGSGVALDIKGRYLTMNLPPFSVAHSILGAGQRALLIIHAKTLEEEGCEIRYRSQDGRRFITRATKTNGPSLVQETYEAGENWEVKPA
jgi:hypothetical protein